MRNLFVLAGVLLLAFTQQSCRRVNGNHNVVTETRNVSSFNEINLGGFANVYLTQGNSTEFKITGESNIINYIHSRVEGNRLIIGTRGSINLNPGEPVNIYITTPDIEKVSVSGAGNVISQNKWDLKKDIELHVSGAGKIKTELNGPGVEITVSGAGDVVIDGETKDVKVHVSGAGKVKAENLKAESADVHISGAGHADIFASVYLNAHVSGAGNINYWGNPQKVDRSTSGAGDINKK